MKAIACLMFHSLIISHNIHYAQTRNFHRWCTGHPISGLERTASGSRSDRKEYFRSGSLVLCTPFPFVAHLGVKAGRTCPGSPQEGHARCDTTATSLEIGRAECRERVCQYG